MTSFSKEDLLPKIPALKADGSNWLTFRNHVEWATEAKGLIEYLEGTKPKPIDPSEGQDPLWEPSDSSCHRVSGEICQVAKRERLHEAAHREYSPQNSLY